MLATFREYQAGYEYKKVLQNDLNEMIYDKHIFTYLEYN